MLDMRGPYRNGAVFHLLAALLIAIGGLASGQWGLLILTALSAASGYGLLRGSRGLAYFAFILAMIGLMFAISRMWVLPDWIGWTFTIAAISYGLAALTLFAALWRSKPEVTETVA